MIRRRRLAGPQACQWGPGPLQGPDQPGACSRAGATGPGDRDRALACGPLSAVTVQPGQTHRSTDTGCRKVTNHGLAGPEPL